MRRPREWGLAAVLGAFGMRLQRTALAWVVSGLLHGALLLLLLRVREPPRPLPRAPPLIELDLLHEPDAREPEGSGSTLPAPRAQRYGSESSVPKTARWKTGAPAQGGPTEAREDGGGTRALIAPNERGAAAPLEGPVAGAGLRGDVPRALDLSLGPSAVPFEQGGADPRGHLLRNEPGAGPDRAALLQEEAREVRRRVDTVVEDDLAALRVADGAVDTYFADLGRAMEKQAAHPPPFVDGNGLRAIVHSYKREAANYGAQGNPRASAPVRNGRSAAEGLAALDRVGADSPGAPRLGFEEYEQLRNFVDGLGKGLVAVVEVRQTGDGRLLEARLLEPSGSPQFDAHVLRIVPDAVLTLPSPPARGAGIHADGMRSRWAFEGKVSYRRRLNDGVDLAEDGWYLALATALGAVRFDEVTGEVFVPDLRLPQYLCSARLLQVY